MKVLLLSGEVHCGKTTLLKGWCERAIAAGAVVQGTLAWPDDARGRRHFTSLPGFETRRAQVSFDDAGEEEQALRAAGVCFVTMGPYTFREDVFEWAKACVEEPLHKPCPKCGRRAAECECSEARYLVVDEVGPLEINRGVALEPSITRLFAAMREGRAPRNLVVVAVVRSRCVEGFKAKYAAPQGTPPAQRIPVEDEFLRSQDWAAFSEGVEYVFPYVPKQ